ncbi:hypothetical protein IFR05_011899 [Cadophora sp. M221]|nr:hypothetical protein IFR05_011899 [Cadophora sp. M221]
MASGHHHKLSQPLIQKQAYAILAFLRAAEKRKGIAVAKIKKDVIGTASAADHRQIVHAAVELLTEDRLAALALALALWLLSSLRCCNTKPKRRAMTTAKI